MTQLDTLEYPLASRTFSAAAYSQYYTGDVSKDSLKDYTKRNTHLLVKRYPYSGVRTILRAWRLVTFVGGL